MVIINIISDHQQKAPGKRSQPGLSTGHALSPWPAIGSYTKQGCPILLDQHLVTSKCCPCSSYLPSQSGCHTCHVYVSVHRRLLLLLLLGDCVAKAKGCAADNPQTAQVATLVRLAYFPSHPQRSVTLWHHPLDTEAGRPTKIALLYWVSLTGVIIYHYITFKTKSSDNLPRVPPAPAPAPRATPSRLLTTDVTFLLTFGPRLLLQVWWVLPQQHQQPRLVGEEHGGCGRGCSPSLRSK